MILTGKAREDFIKYMCEKYPQIRWHDYENMIETIMSALIIEWFDSIGIYVNAISYYDHWRFIVRFQYDRNYKTRQEALEAAIAEANERYNE